MLGQASNQMLEQAEQAIQQKVPPAMQANLAKIIHAGLTILYSPKLSQQLSAKLKNSSDPAKDAGEGAVRMVSNLYQQSGKTMPKALVVPAAMIFAFEYLDLVAKAGNVQITPDLIAQTAKNVSEAVLPLFGVTKDKLAFLIAQKGQGGAQQAPMAPSASAPAQVPQGIIGQAQGAM